MEVEKGEQLLAESDQQEVEETKRQVTDQEKHFHVLAVDDSLIDRKLLEKLLKISSFQVTCVDSGDKALEYLGLLDNLDCEKDSASLMSSKEEMEKVSNKVNMIMTDYCMPGMTGYDLLKRVKGSSSWKDVPVVVMSSENVPSRINMCLNEGAEDFILKPLQLSDMEKLQPHILKSLTHHPSTSSSLQQLLHMPAPPDNDVDDDDGPFASGISKRKVTAVVNELPQLLAEKRLKPKMNN